MKTLAAPLRILLFFYNYLINTFVHIRQKVAYQSVSYIRGRIYIRNKGEISIGKRFTVNSGKRHNPIGEGWITRLIATQNARIVIGDNVMISNSTIYCTSTVEINDYVAVGGNCKIWDTDFHSITPSDRAKKNDKGESSPIKIERIAFIGGNSIILKGVNIGENSVIGAGSVVTRSVPANEIWGGNPAKFIKSLKRDAPE